jgi:hypothetical protein
MARGKESGGGKGRKRTAAKTALPVQESEGAKDTALGVKEIVEGWEYFLEESGVKIPHDPESRNLLTAAAYLVKLCELEGHEPRSEELELENEKIQTAIKNFLLLARPYFERYDDSGLDPNETKARFLAGLAACIRGSLNNWERGLSQFLQESWEDTGRYAGVAEKIIRGTYSFPAAIDSEGYELEWE